MIDLKASPKHPIIARRSFEDSSCIRTCRYSNVELLYLGSHSKNVTYCGRRDGRRKRRIGKSKGGVMTCCSFSVSSSGSGMEMVGESAEGKVEIAAEVHFGNLVSEFGWRVRRLVQDEVEMKKVAQVQAEAFHIPVAFFNDLSFEFFKAEVLSGLLYKLRNSPEDRYACLIAEPADTSDSVSDLEQKLVGVVDVTVLRDKSVLCYLDGAEEYLYISGIAVLEDFRRKKVATVLLKACDLLSFLWGYEYLVLRAYEDDAAALRLYTNAGYKIFSADSPWTTSWIGRRRRVLMIKRSSPHLST